MFAALNKLAKWKWYHGMDSSSVAVQYTHKQHIACYWVINTLLWYYYSKQHLTAAAAVYE